MPPTSLVPQLAEGSLDLAVINHPPDHPDLTGELLFDEDPMLVAPLEHPSRLGAGHAGGHRGAPAAAGAARHRLP
jgi:DNA-binding transcriptional LysR family regulator